jgi:YfiR/HmsC-like
LSTIKQNILKEATVEFSPSRRFNRLLLIIIIFLNIGSYAQTEQVSEYQLKAAYLFNFLKFVQWPDSVFQNNSSPIIIGILGQDPFGSTLDKIIHNEKIDNHPIIIKRYTSLDQLDYCHALFVSSSEQGNVQKVLKDIGNSSILTVSDIDDFGTNGGDIGFYIENNKLRFTINIKSLKQADIKISSRLLRLAKIINPS